jgi:hypothetical protein
MKTQFLTTLLLLLLSYCSHAQHLLEVHVYFDINKQDIRPSDLQKINQVLDSLTATEIFQIELFGHTDSIQSAAHNQALSERRIEVVRTLLLQKGIDASLITSHPMGETAPITSNQTQTGRQQNRRTQIIFHLAPTPVISIAPEEAPPTRIAAVNIAPEEKIDCSKDTTLTMPNGTLVTFGLCEYYANKECFSFTEFIHPDSARAAGLSTMSADGSPLISVGMFHLELCDGSPCVKVRIPVRVRGANQVCNSVITGITRWYRRPNGTWTDSADPMEIEEIDGKLYYTTKACGPGWYNGDKKGGGCAGKYYQTRVKVAKGLTLLTARVSFSAPFTISEGTKKRSKRLIKIPLAENGLCSECSEAFLYAKAVNKNGEILVFDYALAAPYHKRTAFGRCGGKVVKKFLFFFKIKEKTVYRKYFLKQEDFKLVAN